MIVIVGESGSGKSTLQKYISEKLNIKSVVSTTTRPIRKGEKNNIDYKFISTTDFEDKMLNKEFIEHAEYNGWRYGIELGSLLNHKRELDNDCILVLTPHGTRILKRYIDNYNVKSKKQIQFECVYLKVDRKSRLIKLLETRDDIDECVRRSQSDVGMFDGIEDEVNIVVDNSEYRLSVETIFDQLFHRLRIGDYKHV